MYAANVNYDTVSSKLQTGVATFTDINTLTVGNVTIHGIDGGNGNPYGITIGDDNDGTGNHVMISNQDISATGYVHASIISSGINARMSDGKVVAQNGLYIGTTDLNDPKYENSRFAVNGDDGSFKAASGKFNVSDSGAITAESLTLADNYNVKDKIEANKKSTEDNKANLGTLETKTQGITRKADGSTTVDGVNFKNSAVSGVQSINGDIEFDKAGTNTKVWVNGAVAADGVAANNITANSSLTVGDATNYVHMSKEGIAVSGRLYSSLDHTAADLKSVSVAEMANTRDNTNKISYNDTEGTKIDSDVIINASKKNQVKITEGEGIVVGLNSSVINDDGVFAGGHDYNSAKAALNASDGSIKGANGKFAVDENGAVSAADGAFGVDKDGNVKTGNIQGNNITATGVLKGASLDVTGNATVGGTLDVTGKTTLKNELQVDKTAIFGIASGSQTFINGDEVKTGRIETTKTQSSSIGGVTLHNGQITADSMTINGNIDLENLKVKNELTVANNTKITEGTLQLGTADDNKLTAEKLANINQTIKSGKVIEANSATIGGVEIKGGNVTTATGTIQGNTISDGAGATLTGGKITANEGKIGNVEISAAGEVTGVKSIKASTFKVDEENYLNGNGITAKGGKIGEVKIEGNTLNIGSTKLDKTEGITTNKLTIDGMTLTDTKLDTGNATFEVNGVEFKQGQVTAMAGKGFVAGTSSFKQGSLIVDDNNKLEATNGLTTEKATVKGNLDVTGNATFGTAGSQTTIDGDVITTDTLKANKLILGASGAATVVVDKDGSLKAANEKFVVDKDGALKAADGAFTVAKDGETNFKKDDNNLSSINGGNIWAKATDVDNHTSSVLLHDSKGLHVRGTKAGETSAFDFDAATGISTFTGQDSTTTTVNGSVITSTKATGNTGVLDGSNLTLTNGANKTVMTAGGVTFTGKQGASTQHGDTTTIDGGIITTDTLKVQRIQLGEKIVDERTGKEIGSGVTLAADGGFTAAGGNFKVVGGATGSRGSITNVVGDDNSGKTVFETNQQGANMSFKKGDVKSEVAVADGKAEMAVGANAAVTTTDGKVEIKGGTQTVTTTDAGTVFDNGSSAVRPGGATTTIINGNEITTGKITTDQLVITGQGNAHGNGSIAFGGNGTIKSDINDGTTNGKNTSFETTLDGVNTKVTNGTTTTENKVTAEGNSNTVKQDDTHKSEFNQGLTSIGGVVTNGEIKVAQKLDGATGLLTNEVTDANGSSKLEQSGTGLTYTDSANAGNATRIDSSDVSIGSKTDPDKRINLSDLGQIDELDKELTGRDEYKNNPTAVGGINAEAAIRREEVARLDGRINDVNDRVNKVGAMAAAIASLKSIGYDPQAPSEFSIGLGQYKGETGVAMGFFHYPNKNFMINVSLSTAGGETMGGIGATWRFGHKSPQKLLEEQREEQAKKELAAAEKYQAAAKLAKEAQERAEYAAKLARQAQVSADNAKAAADATQAKHFG